MVEPGIRPDRVVTQVRDVEYLNSREPSRFRFDREFEPLTEWTTKGKETVEEVYACPKCSKSAKEPEVVGQVTRKWTMPRPKDDRKRRPRPPTDY